MRAFFDNSKYSQNTRKPFVRLSGGTSRRLGGGISVGGGSGGRGRRGVVAGRRPDKGTGRIRGREPFSIIVNTVKTRDSRCTAVWRQVPQLGGGISVRGGGGGRGGGAALRRGRPDRRGCAGRSRLSERNLMFQWCSDTVCPRPSQEVDANRRSARRGTARSRIDFGRGLVTASGSRRSRRRVRRGVRAA
jgi:hypothetical protein